MEKTLSEKLAEAIAKRKTKYVVCVEGKIEDIIKIYNIMQIEESIRSAIGQNKMYIICEDHEQADSTCKILNEADGLYAHLV